MQENIDQGGCFYSQALYFNLSRYLIIILKWLVFFKMFKLL